MTGSNCSLEYITIDTIVQKIRSCGRGARLGKLDINSAYRIVPVHPGDRILLGMQWKGQFYVDSCLPFGLRSAPKIFNSLADALQWIMQHRGVRLIDHYLDDFITVGKPQSSECASNMEIALSTCAELGVPVASEKVEGPATCLEILGIEIDTVAMEIRLPVSKLAGFIREWRDRKVGKKPEVQSLVGHLCHACRVVRPGRRFLRGMFHALSCARRPHHYVRINARFRADLEWWHTFLRGWNGVYMLPEERKREEIWSNASGSWGCAAYWGDQWFQLQWSEFPGIADKCIASKELLPILTAAAVWGRQWERSGVKFHCDNMAVVTVLNSGYCKDPHMAHMLRCLFFLEARFNFTVVAEHVPGVKNQLADALSRNKSSIFLQSLPSARAMPTEVSSKVVEGLVSIQEWKTDSWSRWFSII